MKRLDAILLGLAGLTSIASIVLWAARPTLLIDSLAGLLIGVLLVGCALFVRLGHIERRQAGSSAPDEELLATISRRLGHGVGSVQESTRRAVVRDIGALLTLHDLVKVRGETPAQAPWVALPETVLALVGYVSALPDEATVLDVGSGLSTVWLALAADQQDRGIRVISLEHDPAYAESTRAALARQGLTDAVDLRLAPLEQFEIDGESYEWYAAGSYRELDEIQLVFIDGPPGSTGPRARYPALSRLAPRLADGAVLVLDDTNRSAEKQIVRAWTDEKNPHGRLVVERVLDHATVLRFQKSLTVT